MDRAAILAAIALAAAAHGVCGTQLTCIVERESSYQADAVGLAGEIGLAQYLPSTHEWLAGMAGHDAPLGDPAGDVELLAWSVARGYGWLWSTWEMCPPRMRWAGRPGIAYM